MAPAAPDADGGTAPWTTTQAAALAKLLALSQDSGPDVGFPDGAPLARDRAAALPPWERASAPGPRNPAAEPRTAESAAPAGMWEQAALARRREQAALARRPERAAGPGPREQAAGPSRNGLPGRAGSGGGRGRRRQWGRDRRTQALPMVPQPVSDRRIALGRLAIITTVTAWLGYVVTWFFADFFNPLYEGVVSRAEAVLYLLIVTMLTTSALAYLLSRLGFFYRTRSHHRASRAILDQFFDTTTPTLTTIVPSYQEESHVVRNTLLSAALQEYPDKRVVLLIDDPPTPKTQPARELLLAARALPGQIEQLLAGPASQPVPPLRHPPAVRADLAATGRHRDDRPEQHPG